MRSEYSDEQSAEQLQKVDHPDDESNRSSDIRSSDVIFDSPKFTICDPYLFTIGTWIEGDGIDTTKLPRVMEHRKRMLARPAVQKALAAEGTQIS
jgi:hypothetical protein